MDRNLSPGRNHHHRRPIGDPISTETPPAASSETPIFSSETPIFSSKTPIFSSRTPIFPPKTPIFSSKAPMIIIIPPRNYSTDFAYHNLRMYPCNVHCTYRFLICTQLAIYLSTNPSVPAVPPHSILSNPWLIYGFRSELQGSTSAGAPGASPTQTGTELCVKG